MLVHDEPGAWSRSNLGSVLTSMINNPSLGDVSEPWDLDLGALLEG
jgi:hypothetical protein